jgi:hypothetical protein
MGELREAQESKLTPGGFWKGGGKRKERGRKERGFIS